MASFAAPFSTTGIGTLPTPQVSEACRFVFGCGLDIPFWPQLPACGFLEQMIPQFAHDLPGAHIDLPGRRVWFDLGNQRPELLGDFYQKYLQDNPDLFPLAPSVAAGFAPFLELARSAALPALKGHVTGPFTIGLGLNDQTGRPIYYDAELRDVLVKALTLKGLWQIQQLKPLCQQPVIFIDEPILSAIGTPAYLAVGPGDVVELIGQIVEPLRKAGAVVGLHCCGNTDWATVVQTGIHIVSFDAFGYARSLSLYPEAVLAFLDRGGMLAWGIVPTSSADALAAADVPSLRAKLEQGMKMLVDKGADAEVVRSQSLLTPSCGCGPLPTMAHAHRVFELLRHLRDQMRG
jgi:hypothetical protein